MSPEIIPVGVDSRLVTAENPSGARGSAGAAGRGRKGSPAVVMKPGDVLTLMELDGPGVLRHLWVTYPSGEPEEMRSVWMEVFYDGLTEPSISVPLPDFFAQLHGRAVPFSSALVCVREGRGFNAYFPMPFRQHIRIVVTNSSLREITFFYQAAVTLETVLERAGYLHATFRRENPTTPKRDFVIEADLTGPGRFLGCCIGIRPLEPYWYGEGEFKVYLDGDEALPTICGTGLEDYVGSAWGMRQHQSPYAGAHLIATARAQLSDLEVPDLVGLYRWHLPDPIVFQHSIRATIQQIGGRTFRDRGELNEFANHHELAGDGLMEVKVGDGVLLAALYERSDDFCATAFTYCLRPQRVPRLDLTSALADIARLPYESATTFQLE